MRPGWTERFLIPQTNRLQVVELVLPFVWLPELDIHKNMFVSACVVRLIALVVTALHHEEIDFWFHALVDLFRTGVSCAILHSIWFGFCGRLANRVVNLKICNCTSPTPYEISQQ